MTFQIEMMLCTCSRKSSLGELSACQAVKVPLHNRALRVRSTNVIHNFCRSRHRDCPRASLTSAFDSSFQCRTTETAQEDEGRIFAWYSIHLWVLIDGPQLSASLKTVIQKDVWFLGLYPNIPGKARPDPSMSIGNKPHLDSASAMTDTKYLIAGSIVLINILT